MNKTLEFERRPGESHWKTTQPVWVERVAMVAMILALATFFFAEIVGMGIKSWDDLQQARAGAAEQVRPPAEVGGQPGKVRAPEWRPGRLARPVVYLLFALLAFWAHRCEPRRRALVLTADTLSHTYRAPFGLNRLLKMEWTIPLREIKSAEIMSSTLSYMPGMIQLNVVLRDGTERKIDAANWFAPGVPVLAPLKPKGEPGLLRDEAGLWMKPENQQMLGEAAFELPLLQALRARGVMVSSAMSDARQHDIFASRAVKLGVCVGLGLVLAALGLMLARNNQHLVDGIPLWIYPVVAVLLILAYTRLSATEAWRPPVFHHFIALTLFVAGSLIALPQLTSLINGFGVATQAQQAFIVREGYLEAVDGASGVARMDLPGKQSRIAWLKGGTTIQLELKQGRLGLWEYDDTPLRDAADAQGIR